MEIGWTDVGSGRYILVSCAHSNTSLFLQDEYEELLKYAVVVPKYDQDRLPKTLTDIRESFPQDRPKHRQETLVTVTRERQTG
jgi:hypothetical protein